MYRDDLSQKKATVAHSVASISTSLKPLNAKKAVKILAKLKDLAEKNIYPFEEPLDMDSIEGLVKQCLTKSLYWHTPATALDVPIHFRGVCEITRALTHTVDPGARPWWLLEHIYPLLDIAESILQHPQSSKL